MDRIANAADHPTGTAPVVPVGMSEDVLLAAISIIEDWELEEEPSATALAITLFKCFKEESLF